MSYHLGLYEDVVAAAKAINSAAGCPVIGRNARTGEADKAAMGTVSVCEVEPSADDATAYLRVAKRHESLLKGRVDALTEVSALPGGFRPDAGPDTAQKRARQVDYLTKCDALRGACEPKP